MAAYGALVSVMQTIDQILRHPYPPISLHKKQTESLIANVAFLQEFLEGYNPHVSYSAEADPLESRIAEAAYAAEDVIESYIVDQILSRSSNHAEKIRSIEFIEGYDDPCFSYGEDIDPLMNSIAEAAAAAEDVIESYINDRILARSTEDGEKISSVEFYEGLQKVIEEMDLIKMEIEKKMKEKKMGFQIKKSLTHAASVPSTSTSQKVSMVGFEDVLYQMLEKLVGGGLNLQIIPIVGMGGIGKTTLARNIYANSLVNQHFDACAWSSISQEYNTPRILREILDQVDQGNSGKLSEEELGEKVYKYLIGRRYFIVMDDMWSIEAWDKVRRFFPDDKNGSRIVITTRLSNLASQFSCSNGIDMKFLDEAKSWNLFYRTVFGEGIFPPELEDIGKKILKGCRGLPLSIVVIGGLLSRSEPTRENWEVIERNLSSVVNSEDDESCLQILYMSYNNLPCYVKPCFLYMGIFGEDADIPLQILILLLVAEGLIKPKDERSLEEVAEDYIQELIDRNLVLVGKLNPNGKVKSCKIHDLLRDVCLREARKVKFLSMLGEHSVYEIPQGISSQRRIVSTLDKEYPPNPLFASLESATLVRSLLGSFPGSLPSRLRLLRVCLLGPLYVKEESSDYYEEILIQQVNLRFLFVGVGVLPLSRTPSSVSFLWNLQTLVLHGIHKECILEIWRMPQLRHVMIMAGKGVLVGAYCFGTHPPLRDELVLEDLRTLSRVGNLNFGEGVLKIIPNIKKLKLAYYPDIRGGGGEEEEDFYDVVGGGGGGDYCLKNLQRLLKLESLSLFCISNVQIHTITFPLSLKKLTLALTGLPWEEMKTKIGCLPLLQVLKLEKDAFTGSEWETVEGQFSSLKFLLIEECDMEYWITDTPTSHASSTLFFAV